MKSRIISGIVAAVYLALAFCSADAETVFHLGIFLVFPLACIWFSDATGGYTGMGMGHGAITSATPGCLVAFGGWLLLFLPIIIGLISYINEG